MKVLRHPETNEVIWLEASVVLDLLEPLVALRLRMARVYGEAEGIEANDPAVALLRSHGRLQDGGTA